MTSKSPSWVKTQWGLGNPYWFPWPWICLSCCYSCGAAVKWLWPQQAWAVSRQLPPTIFNTNKQTNKKWHSSTIKMVHLYHRDSGHMIIKILSSATIFIRPNGAQIMLLLFLITNIDVLVALCVCVCSKAGIGKYSLYKYTLCCHIVLCSFCLFVCLCLCWVEFTLLCLPLFVGGSFFLGNAQR